MADLGSYSDKLKQDDPNQPGAQQGVANGTSGVVSGASQGGAPSVAGVGAGGLGGWTNIQSYLDANKGDNGSSKNLQDKAGGLFDSENQNLQTQADTTKTQAQGEASKVKDATDNSKQWVNQAANAYDWSGNQNNAYNDNAGKLKHAVNDAYSGPNSFAYGKSADFQKAGSALGNDGAFNNYMNDIYKDKAGGQLNQGQGALQTQLDVNNQGLADARKSLLDKYAGFDANANDVTAKTDAAIQDSRNQYGNNQSQLKNTLQNYGNDYQTSRSQAEADARAGYKTDYGGQSSLGSILLPKLGDIHYGDSVRDAQAHNAYGDNMTWEQLQNEKDLFNPQIEAAKGSPNADPTIMQGWDRNTGGLDGFYKGEDQKYANTGDSEKKNWNTIMDILGNTDRAKQGFAVRG